MLLFHNLRYEIKSENHLIVIGYTKEFENIEVRPSNKEKTRVVSIGFDKAENYIFSMLDSSKVEIHCFEGIVNVKGYHDYSWVFFKHRALNENAKRMNIKALEMMQKNKKKIFVFMNPKSIERYHNLQYSDIGVENLIPLPVSFSELDRYKNIINGKYIELVDIENT